MTKHTFLFLLLCLLTAACSNQEPQLLGERPSEDLSQELLNRFARYYAKLPSKATQRTKFEPRFDEGYAELAGRHRLDLHYYDAESNHTYLLVSRIAPSLQVKRVATGIKFRMEGDSIAHYEEIFRTWKMPEEELAQKGGLLFDKMTKGEDLSPYYSVNSGEEEYIEFPDEHTSYNVEKRAWESEQIDPLKPYYPQPRD